MNEIKGITKRDIERFTEADCHILARRLHRVSGLPIHALKWQGELTDHAFNMVGNKIIDVMGLWDKKSFLREWQGGMYQPTISEPIDPLDLYHWGVDCTARPFYSDSYKRARIVADILLDNFVR